MTMENQCLTGNGRKGVDEQSSEEEADNESSKDELDIESCQE